MSKYIQQGDVLIGQIDNIPTEAVLRKNSKFNILQEGEHTGHAHRLDQYEGEFEVYDVPSTKEVYLKVIKPTNLFHEEHKALTIEPGSYKIGIVEEYDPFSKLVRRVID